RIFVRGKGEDRTVQVVVFGSARFNAREILAAGVGLLLQFLEVPGVFLQGIQTLEQGTQQLCVAGAQEKQALLFSRFIRRSGTVGQDQGVAQNVVAQLLGGDVQVLLKELVQEPQLLHFLPV